MTHIPWYIAGPALTVVAYGAHHNDIVETAGASYREHLRSFYMSLTSLE